MKRMLLRVAYDGTNYCGWQRQPNGITIEEVLNGALSALLREEVAVIGASRTDSGVHAMGNVAVFDTMTRIPAEKLKFAVNHGLPPDIRVWESREVDASFHPRHCESRKTYEYRICNREIEIPTMRLYRHFVHAPLDVGRMREGAAFLVGTHDFASFCAARSQAATTIRTLYGLSVEREGDCVRIRAEGSGFLYHMVRILAGTLIEVGMGAREPLSVREALEARSREKAGPTAPARGLCLMGIEFGTRL